MPRVCYTDQARQIGLPFSLLSELPDLLARFLQSLCTMYKAHSRQAGVILDPSMASHPLCLRMMKTDSAGLARW